jgi:hypothetical protein
MSDRPWVPGGPESSMMPQEGRVQMAQEQEKATRLAKEAIFIWNNLVEDKGPLQQKQDELGWERRIEELLSNDGFQNFLNANTIADKMMALRDTGMRGGYNMTDEQLAQYILKHSPTSLTEDPAVSTETRLLEEEMNKPKPMLNKKNPFSSYYNLPKAWGKEPSPEDRYYSDPEEKGTIIPPWLKR